MRLFGRFGKSRKLKKKLNIGIGSKERRSVRLASAALSVRGRKVGFPRQVRVGPRRQVRYRVILPEQPALSPAYFSPKAEMGIATEPVRARELYIGRVVRLVEGESWKRTVGSYATIDVSSPAIGTRILIIGSSGAGKTNLCKVLVEEYFDKDRERQIFVLDNENEYPLMARKSVDYGELGEFGMTPKAYPVRVISLPFVLKSYEKYLYGISPMIELMPLKVDFRLINTPMLQFLTGFIDPKITPYLEPAIQDYIATGNYSFEGLETAIDSSEALSEKIKKGIIGWLNSPKAEEILGEFDYKRMFASRRINIFFFPSSVFTSFEEITAWAMFFSTFIRRLAEETSMPIFAVMDEAREYAKALHQRKAVKQEIGSIFTKGRKREIDAVLSTNSAEVLSDILPNVTHAFYFRFRGTSMPMGRRVYPSERIKEEAERLARYQAIMDSPDENLTTVVRIRPARSFNPPHRRAG